MSHLEDFEVVLRFFYQVSDGKVHSLSVPGQHEKKTENMRVCSCRTLRQLFYQSLNLQRGGRICC